MSKLFEHLDVLEDWANEHHDSKEVWEHSIPIQEALERLEAIDNAKPSEAIEWLNQQIQRLNDDLQHYTMVEKDKAIEYQISEDLKELNTIKQALIKAQEMEKALEIIFKKTVGIFQLKCCKNVNEYNDLKFSEFEKLTEEEFVLLKR